MKQNKATILHGDMRDSLRTLPENSIDSVVTDPPYHLTSVVKRFGGKTAAPAKHGTDGAFTRASAGFMGKVWDGGDIAFDPKTWAEVYRVMKPGAYIIAFSSSRTFARMAVALEDAGFVTHPMIGWVYGSGMPKATRLKIPGTDHLRYGTQSMKPALEPIFLGQKPMVGTGTDNWLRWGTGCLDIESAYVPAEDKTPAPVERFVGSQIGCTGFRGERDGSADHKGRWPANLMHDGSDAVLDAFAEAGDRKSGASVNGNEPSNTGGEGTVCYGEFDRVPFEGYADSGSAARFFNCEPYSEQDFPAFIYQGKASSADRFGSKHPTVKPLRLMRRLVKLVTPPQGIVLDPFAGTGTTGQAAIESGFNTVLCEQEDEYVQDILRRLGCIGQ